MDTGYQEHTSCPGALYSARWALLTARAANPLRGAPFPLLWVCEPQVGTKETEHRKKEEENIAKTQGIEVKFEGRLQVIFLLNGTERKAETQGYVKVTDIKMDTAVKRNKTLSKAKSLCVGTYLLL